MLLLLTPGNLGNNQPEVLEELISGSSIMLKFKIFRGLRSLVPHQGSTLDPGIEKKFRKKLVFYTIKMTYILTKSAISLKHRTGFILFGWIIDFFVKGQSRYRPKSFICFGLVGYDIKGGRL